MAPCIVPTCGGGGTGMVEEKSGSITCGRLYIDIIIVLRLLASVDRCLQMKCKNCFTKHSRFDLSCRHILTTILAKKIVTVEVFMRYRFTV